MINLKKNDAVVDVIRSIMEKELIGNQKKLDKNHNGHLDKQDFEILRGEKNKKVKEESERTEDHLHGRMKTKKKDDVGPGSNFKSSKVELKAEDVESVEENAFDYKSPRKPEPNGGSGMKQGSRYGGSKQKEKPEQEMPKEKNEEVEHIEEKNWIAGAIKHPGAETAAAKKAGMSVQAYAKKHQHDSGTAGKRARLAMTLKKMKENYEEPILDEMISEVLSKDASAGEWIHDFVHSDNPKFAGKSKAERKKQALAAYYSKKNEEVNEGLKDTVKTVAKKAFKALTGGSDKDQLDRLKKDMYRKEEVESLDEGKMDKMTLSGLWHKHAQHSHWNDQGYGHGSDNPHHSGHAATAIENHVRKHHGNKVADDMVSHSDHHVAYHEYAGPEEAPHHEKEMAKLKKKHGIADKQMHEEVDSNVRTKDTIAGRKPTKQKDDVGPGSDGESTKVKYHPGPMKEGRGPTSQTDQPFITDESKPLKNAKELAKTTMKRLKTEMMGKTGTSE